MGFENLMRILGDGMVLKEEYLPPTGEKYLPDTLKIGMTSDGNVFKYKVRGHHNLLLAPTGSGKTFLCESILSRAHKSGHHVVMLTDVKNEFCNTNKPIQEKFRKPGMMMPKEKPEGLPIKTYRPWFLMKFDRGKKYGNIPAQLSLNQCSVADIKTLMNIREREENLRNIIDTLFKEVEKGTIQTLKELRDSIENLGGVSISQKNAMNRKIMPLMGFEVVGNKHPFDIVNDLKMGFVPNINMEGYKKISSEYPFFLQAYIAILIRKLVKAKEEGELEKPLWVFIEETPIFCPKIGNPSSKREILDTISIARQYNINLLLSSQDEKTIPKHLIKQSKYIFLPKTAGNELIINIFKERGLYERGQIYYNELQDMLREMRQYEWMVIGSGRDEQKIIKPFAPLCYHKETSS